MPDETHKNDQLIELNEQELDAMAGGNKNVDYVAHQLNLVPDNLTQSVSQSVDKIFSAISLIGLNF
ncbi:MAG: hypothetical protein KME28_13255 [Pelatocladus maniniholoensis HA4357-MV3]|jgi:hypothetical protein|uniref:Bacteriocin n=1 Tax=Pelatocladus maniniholoensis HA4357-MV3 TaxID=1117104 RepID=A0A9E3H801_9NOST|nr:hypothetical protein [Pelatocladus maniniholoensis HA4357-MV3]BAZ65528.1 hypothetical protein NIES4106_02670 [Fischerella sp. NIES-4106]